MRRLLALLIIPVVAATPPCECALWGTALDATPDDVAGAVDIQDMAWGQEVAAPPGVHQLRIDFAAPPQPSKYEYRAMLLMKPFGGSEQCHPAYFTWGPDGAWRSTSVGRATPMGDGPVVPDFGPCGDWQAAQTDSSGQPFRRFDMVDADMQINGSSWLMEMQLGGDGDACIVLVVETVTRSGVRLDATTHGDLVDAWDLKSPCPTTTHSSCFGHCRDGLFAPGPPWWIVGLALVALGRRP